MTTVMFIREQERVKNTVILALVMLPLLVHRGQRNWVDRRVINTEQARPNENESQFHFPGTRLWAFFLYPRPGLKWTPM